MLETLATATGTKVDTYTWDAEERRYRDRFGRMVSRENIRKAVDRYTDNLQAEVGNLTERMVAGEVEVGEWQIQMEALIKRGHVAATMIAKGGKDQIGAREWGKTGAILRQEYGYLARFARQLEDGRPVNGGTVARAKMYAIAPTATYENIMRDDDIAEGFDIERRHRHSNNSCDNCVEYESMGWQSAGVLPGIGKRCKCLKRCQCTFERMRSEASKKERAKRPPRKPKAKATPPTPPGKPPGTMAELRRRLEGVEWNKDRNKVVSDYLREIEEPTTYPTITGGMTKVQEMRKARFSDMDWYYPENEPTAPVVVTMRYLASSKAELPTNLTKHTSKVVFTDQSNKDDEFWKKQYNNPNHVSLASAGRGGITVYGDNFMSLNSMSHEMGHNMATGKWGNTRPPEGSDYRNAIESGETVPSAYGANSPDEDFAESVMMYFQPTDTLQSRHPKRWSVVDRLMKEADYAG